jgi:hypothetical protein
MSGHEHNGHDDGHDEGDHHHDGPDLVQGEPAREAPEGLDRARGACDLGVGDAVGHGDSGVYPGAAVETGAQRPQDASATDRARQAVFRVEERERNLDQALPDDGRLSVIAFQGEPLGIYARSKDLYYGLHVPHPSVREYQSRRVSVDTAEPMALVLDGWRAAGGPPVTVDVMEQVLRVKV